MKKYLFEKYSYKHTFYLDWYLDDMLYHACDVTGMSESAFVRKAVYMLICDTFGFEYHEEK